MLKPIIKEMKPLSYKKEDKKQNLFMKFINKINVYFGLIYNKFVYKFNQKLRNRRWHKKLLSLQNDMNNDWEDFYKNDWRYKEIYKEWLRTKGDKLPIEFEHDLLKLYGKYLSEFQSDNFHCWKNE